MIVSVLAALAVAGVAAEPPPRNCLKHLEGMGRTITEYDRQHDYPPEFSYSCLYDMTAGEVRQDLTDLRSVAAKPGCADLVDRLVFPFGLRLSDGRYLQLNRKSICKYAPTIKLKIARASAALDPDRLKSAGWRGLFTADGSIWLNTVKDHNGQLHLRVVTIGLGKARPGRR
jgi:hypothetical protein